jgi:hypothetical protein
MNRTIVASILLFCVGCNRMNDEPREIRINTPEGEVVSHVGKMEPTPQAVTIVEGDGLLYLQSLGDDSPVFVSYYVPDVKEPGLKDYDAAFRAWQLDESPPFSDQQVIELIGGYLGNKLTTDLDMEWVTVTDEFGTDYAVRSKKAEVMSFPFSSVQKRIENHQYDFVHGVYHTIKERLGSGEYKTREAKE